MTIPELVQPDEGQALVEMDAEHDTVLDGLLYLLDAKKQIAKMLDAYKAEALAWCEQNGNLRVSEYRWFFPGIEKRTKCLQPARALERILELTGGDFDSVVEALSSNAIKPGHFKKLLERESPETAGDEFDLLFERVEVTKLKDKAPKKSLIEVDKRFVR